MGIIQQLQKMTNLNFSKILEVITFIQVVLQCMKNKLMFKLNLIKFNVGIPKPYEITSSQVARLTDLINRTMKLNPISQYFIGKFQRTTPEEVRKYIDNGNLILARHESRIVGCILFLELEAGIAQGSMLVVDPEYQGLKVGWKLIRAGREAAKE